MITQKQYQTLSELVKEYKQLYSNEPDLKKYSEYAITYHSTAIEGSSLTESEVIDLLDMGKPANKKEFADNLMVFDHHNALQYVVECAKTKERITETFIKNINAKVMRNTGKEYNVALGTFDSSKGEYRLVGVHAGRRTFPDCQKVPYLMKKLIEYIDKEQKNDEMSVLKFAFELHFRFVSIHPFADGNGRTARLLMNYILMYYDFPIMLVFQQDRQKYISALYEAQESENVTPFYEFMFKQYIKFLKYEIKNYK